MSLKRIITDLKGIRSAKIQVNGDYVVIPADVSEESRVLLKVPTMSLARNKSDVAKQLQAQAVVPYICPKNS